MRSSNRAKRWVLRSGLPEDALTGAARATLCGQSAVLIEGQHGVVEMGERCIRLRTQSGVLSIAGEGLVLHELSLDAAMIRGDKVETLTYGRLARATDH